DCVFTAPPLFNYEEYSNDDTQSIQRYNTLEKWMINFLFVLIDKSWEALEDNGDFILYLCDIRGIKITENAFLYVTSFCDGNFFKGYLVSSGDTCPAWHWKKTKSQNSKKTKAKKQLEQNMGFKF
ncbi:MAG: hypothetical protein WBA74_04215, partial [Cyclobacteriaceae bacterium]